MNLQYNLFLDYVIFKSYILSNYTTLNYHFKTSINISVNFSDIFYKSINNQLINVNYYFIVW